MPSRRAFLATALASSLSGLAAPAIGQRAPFGAALERARGLEQFHAIVVSRDGEPVLEEVVRGPGLDRPVNVKSVSKTVVAALLGAAIDRGELPGVEATLGEVAPSLIPRDADPRVAAITLEDLVSLRAGLERTSGPNYGGWVASGNWVADALARPFVAEPGGQMLYSTGSFHVLGAVLSEATGESLLALSRAWLGRPLGIEIPPWTQDPQGRYMGGNQMALSPRGMARFGEMVRLGGTWDGERVLSEDWIAASLEPRGRSPYSGLAYGYGWFLGRVRGTRYAMARGYGGQVIAVAPDAGITVAITSDPNQPARSAGYFGALRDIVERDILGAAA